MIIHNYYIFLIVIENVYFLTNKVLLLSIKLFTS